MKIKLGLILLLVVAVAIIVFQYQTETTLRAEIEMLHQQIAQSQTDNESLSNRLAATADTKSLPDEQLNELLKLRGEVGVLRNQITEFGKLREENRQLQSQVKAEPNSPNQLSPQEQFELHRIDMVTAMKQLGLAMRIYAGDHNNQYATNFDQLKNELGGVTNFDGNISLNDIQFVNAGVVDDTMPQMIIFSERVPQQQSPNGSWAHIYGLADGSVQTIFGDEQTFEEYEKQHSPQPNQ
jgi:hypothetical protein